MFEVIVAVGVIAVVVVINKSIKASGTKGGTVKDPGNKKRY